MIGLYLGAGAFVAGLAMGGYAMHDYMAGKAAQEKADLAEAQAKVDELASEVRTTATQSLANETAAYIAGEANAKVIYRTIEKTGADYAALHLTDPRCVIPAAGVSILVAARTGTPIAPAPDGSAGGVPGAGAAPATGHDAGRVVQPNAAGSSAVGGVPATAGNTGGNGPIPGAGAGRLRAKPVPVQ